MMKKITTAQIMDTVNPTIDFIIPPAGSFEIFIFIAGAPIRINAKVFFFTQRFE